MNTTALVIAIIFFITGLIGTVVPILPGAILIYVGMLVYGFMTHFITLNIAFFIIQGLVLVLLFVIDYIASAVGTKRFGGSKQAMWGAIIGTFIGVFMLGPLGIALGPFLGAVIAELLRRTEMNQAIRVGFGTLIGLLGGTLLKLFIEIVMIIYFFVKIY